MRTEKQRKIGAWKHYAKYEALAQQIGIYFLVNLRPYSIKKLSAAYDKDTSFNTTRLSDWDALHPMVSLKARNVGIRDWALFHTVCVMKHVCRHHVLGIEPPEEVS